MNLDKNLLAEIHEKWIKKIKVFFYDAGCSGSKIDIVFDEFEISDNLEKFPPSPSQLRGEDSHEVGIGWSFEIYVEKEDVEKFKDCRITRIQKADHTGEIKSRYIYTSKKVLDRCGCGTSFAFEKKKPTIDLSKLKNLKNRFN